MAKKRKDQTRNYRQKMEEDSEYKIIRTEVKDLIKAAKEQS